MVRLAKEARKQIQSSKLTVLRIESRGWFHSYEGYELEQVILHHVADETDLVEVSSTTLDSDVFLESDGNRGNVMPVPTSIHMTSNHAVADSRSRVTRAQRVRPNLAKWAREFEGSKRTTAAQT